MHVIVKNHNLVSAAMANHLYYYCLFFVTLISRSRLGFQVSAVPYDYSYTDECLAKPLSPQYKGGIVVNPELNEGLKGWTTFGDAKIEQAEAIDGNKYIVASSRNTSSHSFSQQFDLDKDKLYTLSAWLQVSNGSADIAAVLKTSNGSVTAGWVVAQQGCWSMLKGGFVVDASGPGFLYFECNNSAIDIWADSVSLQPFTQEEWKSHQDLNIQKARKRSVKLKAVDQNNQPIKNATVSITLRQSNFPFGCAINQNILHNTAYQNWFTPRFRYTVFENELKWYSTERSQGFEDYSVSDAMINFARARKIPVRGHNVFWDNPSAQPSWVAGLSPAALSAAADRRINSVMSRYRGQTVFHWDVVNENMHFNFFESKLGSTASTNFYLKANKIDPKATPFLNEYNTIEESHEGSSSPAKYLEKIRDLRRHGYNGPLGIGVQGHFSAPNLPYTRSAIDMLASSRLPIWVTELDVKSGPNQAGYLDQILRELHSHAAVQGILLWSAWSPQGCFRMCLTDNNFRNLATGDVVDRFRNGLMGVDLSGRTDSDGLFEIEVFHGEYEAKIKHPSGDRVSVNQTFSVAPDEEQMVFQFKINGV